jgi:hypothetical protein
MAVNYVTVEQLSVLTDQTPRNIHLLTEKGVLKRAADDQGKMLRPFQYELISNVRAYCVYLRELARMDDAGQTLYTQLRNKKMGAEAEKAILDLKLYKAQLHRGKDVEFIITTMFTSIKSRLLAIPSRVTRVLMGKTVFQEIYAIIYTEIELALRELSDYDPNAFHRAGEDQPLAPQPNGSSNHREDLDAVAVPQTE